MPVTKNDIISSISRLLQSDTKASAVQATSKYIAHIKKRPAAAEALVDLCAIAAKVNINTTWDEAKYKNLEAEHDKVVREHAHLREKIIAITKQTGYRAVFLKTIKTVNNEIVALVMSQAGREEVKILPDINEMLLLPGIEVVICPVGQGVKTITEIRGWDYDSGRLSKVLSVLHDGSTAVVEEAGAANGVAVKVASQIQDDIKEGDVVRYEPQFKMAFEVISKGQLMNEYSAEGLQNFTFDDIGGLKEEKQQIKEKIIYPLLHSKTFDKYGISTPRGILLHGPPGTGKTMMACAIFNEIAEMNGATDIDVSKNFFTVKSGQVLSKWAGEAEATIRRVFQSAREASTEEIPSIIFWDEIESIARTRTDSSAYNAEKTIVPTLLTEINGIKDNGNVILIAATNRSDLIDPALLRPGRLGDAIIEISRPGKEGIKEIMLNNLQGRPIKENETPESIANAVAKEICDSKVIATINFATGNPLDTVSLSYIDLVNGAILSKVVNDASLQSCLEEINGSVVSGISQKRVIDLLHNEFGTTMKLLRPDNISNYITLPTHLVNIRGQLVTQE
jgi:proteasome ATPase